MRTLLDFFTFPIVFLGKQRRFSFIILTAIDAMHNLKPINIPTLSPDDLIDIYTGVDGWENRQHEYYYRQANYGEHIWLKSKLVAAALSLADHVSAEGEESVFFALDNEPSQLTLAILNELKSDVERRGPPFSWSRSYRN